MRQAQLFELVRNELLTLLGGYIQARELIESIDEYIIHPRLGNRSGVLGALVLAEWALYPQQSPSKRPVTNWSDAKD